jgi:TRAP-type C4-dicarboxylate transport system permease small subunit
MVGLCILLITTGIKQAIDVWPTKAAYMRFLSMGWMYLSIPICGLLMLFFTCVSLVELISKEKGFDK